MSKGIEGGVEGERKAKEGVCDSNYCPYYQTERCMGIKEADK